MKFARLEIHGRIVPVRITDTGYEELATMFPEPIATGVTHPLTVGRLHSPVVPGKIVCIGRNYRAHAKELGNDVPSEPLLFMKPPTAVIGPGDSVVLPPQSQRVEHEGELAVVIGKRIRNIAATNVPSAIFGYTCANDVTARDLQKKDVQFTRAKGFDTFCPLGPWIETQRPSESAHVIVRVGESERQHGFLRDMVFGVDELIAYISSVMTLEPGDVILTGTPEGVGPLRSGDTVEVAIEGVGTLRNTVA